MDEIAKMLLGKNAKAADLGSVESMLRANPAVQAIVDKEEARDNPKSPWLTKKVAPTESLGDKHLNRIKQLIKH